MWAPLNHVNVQHVTTQNHQCNTSSVTPSIALSCPSTGWAIVKIGHSNLWPGSKEIKYGELHIYFAIVRYQYTDHADAVVIVGLY